MGKMQISGTEQKLKTEPRNVLPDSKKSINLQSASTQAPLKMDTNGIKYGAGTPNGTMQIVGTQAKLSDTPTLGYQSYTTPMSQRAIDSKKSF
jgi:hypothetical protein